MYLNKKTTPNIWSSSPLQNDIINGKQRFSIPHPAKRNSQILGAIFLSIWLIGWTAALVFILWFIFQGVHALFLYVMAILWSGGEVLAILSLLRIIRGSHPEEIWLNKPCLTYDSGIPPLRMTPHKQRTSLMYRQSTVSFDDHVKDWKSIFLKRKRYIFSAIDMKSLKLHKSRTGSCLTIDKGPNRIIIATAANETEREWLYNFLNREYE